MIQIADNAATIQVAMGRLFERAKMNNEDQRATVLAILRDVQTEGDQAVIDYTERFDHARFQPTSLRVTNDEIDAAMSEIAPDLLATIKRSAENIRLFHEKQKQKTWLDIQDGAMLGQMIRPIQNVGVYVPGGRAAYPSTVLMNVIPAQVAGVERIVMVTPPDSNGNIDAIRLAAAHIAGTTEIYKVGGAQAVAALAYGTQTIRPVDKITGPGNIFVTLAKREVFGLVGIDMMAGPSEVLIVADQFANPVYIAADMLAQAEHDPLAAAILITDDRILAEMVQKELMKQSAATERNDIAEQSLSQYGTILVAENLDEAFSLANRIAPEHLEVLIESPFDALDKIKNAGAIFLGEYTPESLGDYMAGPNHTLPTNATARFASPLSVDDFMKKSSILHFSKERLQMYYQDIVLFAESEGLQAHADSARIRFME